MGHSVELNKVTKRFKMYKKTSEKLLNILVSDKYGEDFYALQDISFTAEKGDVIGVIGVNGAGKSTLSNLITGVIPPTTGSIEVRGQAALIAIASGLNNQLTGRENIELKCLMLGFNKKEIAELMPEIIEFADIGQFIDQPVKKYSSGMKSRLGFAISVNIDPDVLVIDEALSVGDQTFTDKCLDKMNEFKAQGKTIFFISHSIGQVKKFCQKALWLEAGSIREYGTIQDIIPKYQEFLKEYKAMSKEEQKNFKQIVLEKRSMLHVTKDNEELVGEELLTTRSATHVKKREKKIAQWPKLILFFLILSVIITSCAIFIYQNDLITKLRDSRNNGTIAEDHVDIDKDITDGQKIDADTNSVTEKENIIFINVNKANIRDAASTDSQILLSADFGDAYKVIEQQEILGEIWYYIQLDESNGWVSSSVAEPVETTNSFSDHEMISSIESSFLSIPSITEALSTLGDSSATVDQEIDIEYILNGEQQIIALEFKVEETLNQPVNVEFGEPGLILADRSRLLYIGERYEYLFNLNNDVSVGSIKIRKLP